MVSVFDLFSLDLQIPMEQVIKLNKEYSFNCGFVSGLGISRLVADMPFKKESISIGL